MAEAVEPDKWWSEPPCWGSAEIGLLPKSWERLMGDRFVRTQMKNRKSSSSERAQIQLGQFSRPEWSSIWFHRNRGRPEPPILEQVLAEVASRFLEAPDIFDIPILAGHVLGETRSGSLPLLASTFEVLEEFGFQDARAIDSVLSGTYLDAFNLLGRNVKTLLDLTVTSLSWLDHSRRISIVFKEPQHFDSVELFLQQSRVRSFRNIGLDPNWSHYSFNFANAVGKRWGFSFSSGNTLETAGMELSITRERVRQLEARFPIDFEPRRWPLPLVLQELQRHLSIGDNNSFSFDKDDQSSEVSRKNATKCLVACGVNPLDLEPFGGLNGQLQKFGLSLNLLQREAYWLSNRIGLLFREQFLTEITERFPTLPIALLKDSLEIFASDTELPYGYIYVESKSGSFLRSGLETVLSKNGALEFDELYSALVRYFRYRSPGIVFPPALVIRALVAADKGFEIDDDLVSIVSPENRHLGVSYEWMWETISQSPGLVIHRTELLNKCREAGLNSSTLQVYFAYSLCFKPAGNNCVTLTGHEPVREDIEYARARASVITIPTKILDWHTKGNYLTAVVEVGNSLMDSGLLSLSKAARTVLSGKGFQIYLGDEDFGSSNLSGVVYTGWQTVLSKGSFSVGDQIAIVFDVVKRTAQVALAEDLDDGVLEENTDVEY